MKLLHKKELSELGVTFYFLITPRDSVSDSLTDPDDDEHNLLWKYWGGILQLRYDHGAEQDDELKINNGNVEPHRGFGHIAFNVDDVFAHCAAMEGLGAAFQKRPNEGRMKGLAFALDPNGYWVEVVSRREWKKDEKYNLSQTMLRVKDAKKSLKFYVDILGMRLVKEMHFEKAKFSLYFLSSAVKDEVDLKGMNGDDKYGIIKAQWAPVLELTHNWGTEDGSNDEVYHDGRTASDLGVGFSNVSFLTRLPLNAIAEMSDPDGYKVVLQQRGKSPF